jgi:hypothetical protein
MISVRIQRPLREQNKEGFTQTWRCRARVSARLTRQGAQLPPLPWTPSRLTKTELIHLQFAELDKHNFFSFNPAHYT